MNAISVGMLDAQCICLLRIFTTREFAEESNGSDVCKARSFICS